MPRPNFAPLITFNKPFDVKHRPPYLCSHQSIIRHISGAPSVGSDLLVEPTILTYTLTGTLPSLLFSNTSPYHSPPPPSPLPLPPPPLLHITFLLSIVPLFPSSPLLPPPLLHNITFLLSICSFLPLLP